MHHRISVGVVSALVAQTTANYHYGRDLYGESSDNHTCQLCMYLIYFVHFFNFFFSLLPPQF